MEKTMTLQKRAIAFLSAVILAISMTCVVPFAAYATDTPESSGYKGTITATDTTVSVAVGNTVTLTAEEDDDSSDFKITSTENVTAAYHVDYAITSTSDGGAATINKHSGVLTPSSAGTVTVTAYLLDCEQPSGVSGVPCYGNDRVISSATKTVTITGNTGSYGFQGNDLQIQMTSFNPQVVSSSSTAYVNSLSDVSATDGYYCFVINQSYGTGSNFDTFLANNAGKITLTCDNDDTFSESLGGSVLTLDGTARSNTVTVKILESALTSGNSYTLTFASSYQAGNGNTLGATISFTFSI